MRVVLCILDDAVLAATAPYRRVRLRRLLAGDLPDRLHAVPVPVRLRVNGSLSCRLAEPGVLAPLAGQKRTRSCVELRKEDVCL